MRIKETESINEMKIKFKIDLVWKREKENELCQVVNL